MSQRNATETVVDLDHVGAARIVQLDFRGVTPSAGVRLTRVDSEHGNTLAAYQRMGKPRYPTRKQIDELNRAAVIVPETTKLRSGKLELQLSPNALVLVEVGH